MLSYLPHRIHHCNLSSKEAIGSEDFRPAALSYCRLHDALQFFVALMEGSRQLQVYALVHLIHVFPAPGNLLLDLHLDHLQALAGI